MPEAECQTDEFIELSKEDYKKLAPKDRKAYKIELKEYKAKLKEIKMEKSAERRRLYRNEYMKNYHKQKMRYDPVYREKRYNYSVIYNTGKRVLKARANKKAKDLENGYVEINLLSNLITLK
jgi:hypothetical protein